eukprot:gene1419-2508_t
MEGKSHFPAAGRRTMEERIRALEEEAAAAETAYLRVEERLEAMEGAVTAQDADVHRLGRGVVGIIARLYALERDSAQGNEEAARANAVAPVWHPPLRGYP